MRPSDHNNLSLPSWPGQWPLRCLALLGACAGQACTGPGPVYEDDVVLLDTTPQDFPPEAPFADTAVEEKAPAPDDQCADILPLEVPERRDEGPQTQAQMGGFYTGVDFDFDREGRLITAFGNQLMAYERDGSRQVFDLILSDTPTGMRFLPDGDLLMAMPNLGSLRRLDAETGAMQTVLAGMSYPYGLEVASDGTIFATEHSANGRVFSIDPYTGDATVVAQMAFPLTLALSADEDVLYISSTMDFFSDAGRIDAIDRDPSGNWLPELRFVYDDGHRVDAMASDACGNLYVGSWSGRIYRILETNGMVEQLVTLPTWGLYAARFGASYGDFLQTQLFLTDTQQLFTLDLGIEGRHILAP